MVAVGMKKRVRPDGPITDCEPKSSSPVRVNWQQLLQIAKSFLRFVLCALFACLVISLVIRRWIPVSESACLRPERIAEVRSTIDGSSLELFVKLHEDVVDETDLCSVTNSRANEAELRALEHEQQNLAAARETVARRQQAVELQLQTVEESIATYFAFTIRSLEASRDRAAAELGAATTLVVQADRNNERIKKAGAAVSNEERENSQSRLATAKYNAEALRAESRRISHDLQALRSGLPLSSGVQLVERRVVLNLQLAEHIARESELDACLEEVAERTRVVRAETKAKAHAMCVAPFNGRVVWVTDSAGVVRANEPLVRIAAPVDKVEAVFRKEAGANLRLGAKATVMLASGQYLPGTVERFENMEVPVTKLAPIHRAADQLRVLIKLTSRPAELDVGMPAKVTVAESSLVIRLVDQRLWWLICVVAGACLFALQIVNYAQNKNPRK